MRTRAGSAAMPLAALAALAALGAMPAACSSSDGGAAPAPSATDTDDGGDGYVDLPCPPSGISKGPWSLAMSGTSIKIRWEACKVGTSGDVSVTPEGGGDAVKSPSVETAVTLTERHQAPLNRSLSPDDAPGTYYMHDAAIAGLTPGTCYHYALAADDKLGGRFCTSRPSGQPVHFLYIGDTNPLLGPSTKNVLDNTLPSTPDFILHGGDFEYYDSGLETWNGWFPVMRPLLASGSFQPALGNHELETPDELDGYSLRFFGDPAYGGEDFHYSFESGGIHFHALNTEKDIMPTSEQGQWLSKSLADAAAAPGFRFSIVWMHRPFATCGDNADNDTARVAWEPTFAQYKVPLVLQAHIHIYERFVINGITYVTSGGGGGNIGTDDANLSREECALRVASGPFYHATDITFDGVSPNGRVDAKVIDEAGAVRDTFSLPIP